MGALAVATVAAAVSVSLAPVDAASARRHRVRTPARRTTSLGGHAYLWAIALNTFGSLFLIGGALYSIARRQRVRASLWIGGGALVLALSTSMSRAGEYSFMYLGELIGIALMFGGFTFAGRENALRPASEAAPSHP